MPVGNKDHNFCFVPNIGRFCILSLFSFSKYKLQLFSIILNYFLIKLLIQKANCVTNIVLNEILVK